MEYKVPASELERRMKHFRKQMDKDFPKWNLAAIFDNINLYYFTGTMQDGVLLIPRQDEAAFWVRRSFERAMDESLFPAIKPMESYKDAAAGFKNIPETVYMETEHVTLALFSRFKKHFPFKEFIPIDLQIASIRSIKSAYELSLMEQSGNIHRRVLEERVPRLLREGMSEAEFVSELFPVMIAEGHHGVVRFSMNNAEAILGQIGFGESSIYPTSFNGPGGNYGMNPAVPLIGSRERKLKRGDLVFVDIGCGVNGYHTDKTMTYIFDGSLSDNVIEEHFKCVSIQNKIADQLKPGAIPSEIYNLIMENLTPEFSKNFMGFGNRQVRFLGHSIGLVIDELPVIAKGFDEPLQEGMVFAIEPKKGIKNVGMVGIENTFIVTREGGKCITGDHPGLMPVF
ncbi:MAG: aminopeptidase P family protein [Bacteroidales bacterium]|nr:aminopeptidase P family protein [Bacteroidales bacterium]